MESLGLAAPRRKKKYEIDPRNNAWANDDNKFGQKLMEKFGWEKGKGLGAQEDGETQNIKVKVKNDKHGIGANNDYSDTWLDHQDDFNSVLAALNTCHSAPGSGSATPTNEESTEAVVVSMEERSKKSKSRVHYKKFTQSKDLTRADASDLDALFGRRKKFEKRSKKLKKIVQSEPASPFAGMTPLGTTPNGGNSLSAGEEAPSSDELKSSGSQDKEYDVDGNLRTVTSSLSVSDYFAKKMAEIKAKRNGVSTVVDQFCENSCKQFKENCEKEGEEERRKEEGEESTPSVVEMDKPEIYAQEKFQKASLTVQQYFELKMKEKNAKTALMSEVENNEMCQASREHNDSVKKKKKKKTPSGAENNNALAGVRVTVSKKNKSTAVSVDQVPCNETSEDNDSVKKEKKEKKKKRKCDDDVMENPSGPDKNKKKKKKASLESTSTELQLQPIEIPPTPPKIVGIKEDRKKKKKSSLITPSTEGQEGVLPADEVMGNSKRSTVSESIPEKKEKKKKKKKKVVS